MNTTIKNMNWLGDELSKALTKLDKEQDKPLLTKEYHVGVDVTYSAWVHVDASSEEEAEEIAMKQAEEITSNAGAWVKSEVHCI